MAALPWAPLAPFSPQSTGTATRTSRRGDGRRVAAAGKWWGSRSSKVLGSVALAAVLRKTSATNATNIPKTLESSVELLNSALQVPEASALRMAKDIQKFAVSRDGDDATGSRTMAWTKKLLRGLQIHEGLEPLLRHVGGIEKILLELENRSKKHTEVFQGIAQQHEAQREGVEIDMEEYSKAAEYMGKEWWVRASAQRIIDRIDQYYLLSGEQMRRGHPPWVFCMKNRLPRGWREYDFQGKHMYWNPEKKRMQKQAPEGLEVKEPPEAIEPPVSLLDIGSSINRFQDWPYYVEAHALDLQPAVEGVFQADFFDVPIVEAPNEDGSPFCVKDGKLEGIVANSFDVVVLSLVLSFVPSPEKRIEMVAKARRCLRDHRGLLFVVEGGSAVMEGSWYQKDAAAEWSLAMETAGFKTMHFDSSLRERRRSKPVLQWILETKPIDESVTLEPLVVSKELEW